ncbi:MAG: hypothetical protein LBS58_02190 [Coriobacteriales bacterium]|nr:hypothetical protein [Coriobacteriales bacterium]
MSTLTPARSLALKVTRQVRERTAYAHNLIEAQVRNAPTPPEERAFAILLILGVVQSRGTLDTIIDRALANPHDIKADVRDALRVSAYELVFLGKGTHAAVDQGVELVRSIAPRAAGLANKVLRSIAADKNGFPWGDPAADAAALARLHAFPLWLATRLIASLGHEAAATFMAASNEQAPLYLARTKGGTKGDGSSVLPSVLRIPNSELPAYLPGIEAGEYLVVDASAQEVARIATPPAQGAFLEVGSGRGTKTVLLQGNALRSHGHQVPLIALDQHAFKAQILLKRIAQYGLENVKPVTGDVLALDALIAQGVVPASLAGALIDAPCSGTGTLRRHPEIRWNLAAKDVTAMAHNGLAMLNAVAPHLAPGGFMVYATCSVLAEENEHVIEAFLKSAAGAAFWLQPLNAGSEGTAASPSSRPQPPSACSKAAAASAARTGSSAAKGPYFKAVLEPGGPDAHFAAKLVRRA